MKKLIALLLVLVFITALIGCGKDEPLPRVTNPQRAILGRWELIEDSFGPFNEPVKYDEYLPDSILRIYHYTDETLYSCKYWFEDSILFVGGEVIYLPDDTIVHKEPYQFKFLNYNKLRLDFQYPAVNTKYVYKRKNKPMKKLDLITVLNSPQSLPYGDSVGSLVYAESLRRLCNEENPCEDSADERFG